MPLEIMCIFFEKGHRKANMLANEGKVSSKADNGSLNKCASQRNNSIRGANKKALQTHSHDDIVRSTLLLYVVKP